MPLYTYVCKICNHQFDEFTHKVTSINEVQECPKCPKCKSESKRKLTATAQNPYNSITWFKHQ